MTKHESVGLDLSDVAPRVGQLVGGGQLWEPCAATDIRRWVMALDYPNPIHYDQQIAAASPFGGIVAPQSFVAGMDYGHGTQPSVVGCIPGSHMIFGGEEWWHYGPRIHPGDRLTQVRRFHDYKVADTKFAGPTLFSRGDTVHTNQHGAPVAKERSTAVRYLAAEAEKRGFYAANTKRPSWTPEGLAKVNETRVAWFRSNREGRTPRYEEVDVGDRLPRRALGPHNVASFTTEYRAFLWNAWGAWHWVLPEGVRDPWWNQDHGWTEGVAWYDWEAAQVDPRAQDGLYMGPSRGHIDPARAEQIGMPRSYGYGATMGAWITDYLAYWAGHQGYVRHSNAQFRAPAFEGDVTFLDGQVAEKLEETILGVPLVRVSFDMTNQDGAVLARGTAEIELPLGGAS